MRGAGSAAATALVLALLACGCGGGGDRQGSFELTIGNLVPLRGDLAAYGAAARKSAQLAGERAAAAGAPRTRVAVRSADTESNGQIAQVQARRLIGGGTSCMVGDWAASASFAVAGNVTVPAGIPLISPATSSAELSSLDDSGLVFRTVPSDDLQAIALADVAGPGSGRSLSIAARDDPYGRRFSGHAAAEWRRAGGTVRGPFLYDPGLLHHRHVARQIVAGDPDAIAVIDFPQSFARLAPDLLATGRFDPTRLVLPDVMSVPDPSGAGIPRAAIEGASGTLPGVASPGAGGRAFDRIFGADPAPPWRQAGFDAEVFDASALCFLGAVSASSADGRQIADRIESVSAPPGLRFGPGRLGAAVRALRRGAEIDYQGASGPLDLDHDGDPTAGVFGVYRYRDGHPRVQGKITVRR